MSVMWLDWVILGILLVSTVMGIMRGAIRECVELATWIIGIYLAYIWTPQYQDFLIAYVETPEFRYGLTFMVILIGVLVIGGLVGFFLGKLIGIMGLSGFDRIFGIAFGILRGLFLVVLAVAVAKFTNVPQQEWWQSSVALPKIERLSDRLTDWVLASQWLPEAEKAALTKRLAEQEKENQAKQKNKDWFSTDEEGKKPAVPVMPRSNDQSAEPSSGSQSSSPAPTQP